MKNFITIAAMSIIALGSCKKYDNVSQQVKVSYPTITFSGSLFYSIPVGGTLPTVAATAYDSTLKETETVTIDQSTLDNKTPGLYILTVNTKNHYGYISSQNIYVAVSNEPASVNLAGNYKRTSNSAPVVVTRVANALYRTNDVGGAPTLQIPAYFVQTNDTTIVLPPQPTAAGTLSAANASVHMAPGDTSFSYIVVNGSFGTSLRKFQKQ